MAMNKNWYAKKRLEEQLKFFGAKKTRFISRYAKKPRVRVKRESISYSEVALEHLNRQATGSPLLANMPQMGGLSSVAAQQSTLGLGNMAANNGAALANLIGSAGHQPASHFINPLQQVTAYRGH